MKHKKKAIFTLTGLFMMTAMPGVAIAPPSLNAAIIVFTGNEDRIAAGLRMYMNGQASRLFITGNDDYPDLQTLMKEHNIPSIYSLGGVFFDRLARDTIENAGNARAWMKKQNVQHAYLVTSDFHMNRSLKLLRDEMGDKVFITACPVKSATDDTIIAGENLKYAAISMVPNIALDMPRAWRASISRSIVYASNLLPAYKADTSKAGPC